MIFPESETGFASNPSLLPFSYILLSDDLLGPLFELTVGFSLSESIKIFSLHPCLRGVFIWRPRHQTHFKTNALSLTIRDL